VFRVVVSCAGISETTALLGIPEITAEFGCRPWHEHVLCSWTGDRILLQADNDFDENGQALLDEFSDAICACVPIENTAISFAVESVIPIARNES
jgi:hypothetical protein